MAVMDRPAPPQRDTTSDLLGLGVIILPVEDPAAAGDWYSGRLGLPAVRPDLMPNCGAHVALALPSGQMLVLAAAAGSSSLSEIGVHHGLRVGAEQRRAITARLATDGVAVDAYREDRPEELADNCYICDPDGNRLQLVATADAGSAPGIVGLDHTVLLACDMLWADDFYTGLLSLPVAAKIGVRTADHARARRWAAGEEEMAPGTRRLDKLYMAMGGQTEVPRANMQFYYPVGRDTLGIWLAMRHVQEPPEDQLVGTPRTAFAATPAALDRVAAALARARRPFLGPLDHPAAAPIARSLYFKDMSGNFLELFVPR